MFADWHIPQQGKLKCGPSCKDPTGAAEGRFTRKNAQTLNFSTLFIVHWYIGLFNQ